MVVQELVVDLQGSYAYCAASWAEYLALEGAGMAGMTDLVESVLGESVSLSEEGLAYSGHRAEHEGNRTRFDRHPESI